MEDIYRKKAVWLVDSQVLNAFCFIKCWWWEKTAATELVISIINLLIHLTIFIKHKLHVKQSIRCVHRTVLVSVFVEPVISLENKNQIAE